MFKPLAALIAATTLSVPAVATVDPGTPHLLKTLNEYGVTVLYNPPGCGGRWLGMYSTDKVMKLCYSGRPTAQDHDTVRHETMHALQHCAALRRGDTRGIVPLAINTSERQQWVSSVLRTGEINQIKSVYPARVHQIELEAFAGAAHYTSTELATLVSKWCFK
tara:strand:+ start:314 stop:802 length:489 start_codon:yes stop_codon:yes gene_type:complete